MNFEERLRLALPCLHSDCKSRGESDSNHIRDEYCYNCTKRKELKQSLDEAIQEVKNLVTDNYFAKEMKQACIITLETELGLE